MSKNKKFILIALAILTIFIFFLVLAFFEIRIPCIFKELTGLNCPGCGNTRATVALFKLDFKEMLKYNLLYPLQIAYILQVGIVMCVNYFKKGKFEYTAKTIVIDIIFLILLIVWGIVRNVVPYFAI